MISFLFSAEKLSKITNFSILNVDQGSASILFKRASYFLIASAYSSNNIPHSSLIGSSSSSFIGFISF